MQDYTITVLPSWIWELDVTNDPSSATETWTDITRFVRGATVKRGRQVETGRDQAGTCALDLDNRDRRFDFFNTGEIRNLVSNPSLETNTTGYATNAAAIARNNNGPNSHGSWGLVVTTTNVQGSGVSYGNTTLLPVTPGQAYAASWWVRLASAGTKTMGMLVLWYTAGDSLISYHDTPFTLTQTSHTRIVVKGVAPTNADHARIVMQTYASGQGVFDFWVDALQLESFSATLRNRISNPSVEIDLAGYLAGSSLISRNNNGPNVFGTWGIVCTTTNTLDSGFSYGGASLLPVTAGQSYTASCSCRLADVGSKNFELLIVYFNASDNITGFVETVFDMTQVFQRINVSGTAPLGTTYAAVALYTKIGGQGVFNFWADGLQFEQGSGVVRNMISNPSAENDANGYGELAATVVQSAGNGVFSSDKISVTTTNVQGSGVLYGSATLLPVTPGLPYTASWYVRLATSGAKSMGTSILWRDSNDNNIAFDDLPFTLSSTTYSRKSVTATAPAGAAYVLILMQTYAIEGVFDFYIDAVQFEQAGAATTYSDGDQTGYHWSGAAHASPSMFAIPLLTDYIDGDQPNGVWGGDAHDSPTYYAATTYTDYIDGDQDNGRWSGTAHASTSYRGGPYYPNVKPMRRIRGRATYATTYPLYYGFLDDPLLTYAGFSDAVLRVSATDAFKILNKKLVSGDFPAQRSDLRVASILDAVGWGSGARDLAVGVSTMDAITLENVSALEHLQQVAESESGRLFISAAGDVTFLDRHAAYLTTSQATFGELEILYRDVKFGGGEPLIYNEVLVKRAAAGAVEQSAADSASGLEFMERTLSRTNQHMDSDNEALDKAEHELALYKDYHPRIVALELNGTYQPALVWPQALGRELGDRLTVRRRPTGGGPLIEQASFIESVEHRIGVGTWDTTLGLTSVGIAYQIYPDGKGFFILNDAVYGKIGSSNPGVLVY